jgi:hypothetical protein
MIRYRTIQFAIFIALIAVTCLATPARGARVQWDVRGVQSAGTPITNITQAQKLLSGVIAASTDVTQHYDFINFNKVNPPIRGKFPNDLAFPGTSGDQTNFAVEAMANIMVPSAGAYTFGVSSDDGFSLKVGSFSSSFPGLRRGAESYATFIFDQPGIYPVDLVFFQHEIAAELELFASPGSFTTFGQKGANFQLVGATNGALALANPGVGSSVPEPSSVAMILLPISAILLKRRGFAL